MRHLREGVNTGVGTACAVHRNHVAAERPHCLFEGLLETAYRGATTFTFGGGVNEVQRDIIAGAGLGMPRGRARK